MRLFAPDAAEQMDFARVGFLPTEQFTASSYARLPKEEKEMLAELMRRRRKQGEELTVLEELIVEREQAIILRLMRHKFGDVPEAIVNRLRAITDEETLEALADRVLDATFLSDMGLGDDAPAETEERHG
ncbi:MAG: DUF4351 domain-containing protein [Abditibacteriales bacterium]|nr:DUF4351 domain-containing protein [Abditibacteriales bacterium]MDW8367201.1 DUF4351 domain-containing protein [Abditibacteriales bacterium]